MSSVVDFSETELENIRQDFPALNTVGRGGSPIAYLDSAATSQKPSCVLETEMGFYRNSNGAVHRNTHLLGDRATEAYENARKTVASFIGAHPNQIVWTKNATEALNLVATAIGNASHSSASRAAKDLVVRTGQKIVVTRAEHHSNLVPWQQLAQRTGAKLVWLDLESDGRIDFETLDRITDGTRVVAFTHVSNMTGAVTEVERVVEAAKRVGAITVLDSCQSVAHMPFDVGTLDVDFAVMSSHKMIGPTGVGALWGRTHLLEKLPTVMTGGSTVADVTMEETLFLPPPQKFEAGSQPVAQIVGWAAAIDYLSALGMNRVALHERKMTARILDGLNEMGGIRLLGPSNMENRGGTVCFDVAGIHPHDVGQVLDAHDVAVRVGHHCAVPLHRFFGVKSSSRASVSFTTMNWEVDRFLGALIKVQHYFGGSK